MKKNDEMETWQNAAAGIIGIKKFDRRGELTDEIIRAGQKFTISTSERIFNQDQAATPQLCDFRNGRLIPVRIMDTAEDAKEIAANPNLIGESEMSELLGGHFKTLEAKVKTITNPIALQRFLAMAEERPDATVKQVSLLRERLSEVEPSNVTERDTMAIGNRIEPGRGVSL